MDTPSAIFLIVFSLAIIIVSWHLIFGSTKKRVEEKIALKEFDNLEAERKRLEEFKKDKNIVGLITYLDYSAPGSYASDIRGYAACMLGQLKDASTVTPLIAALAGGVRPVDIIYALKNIGEPSVVPMTEALYNEHLPPNVKELLAKALGELKDNRAIDSLITILKNDDHKVRKSAGKALKKITGKSLGQDYEKWREWRQTTLRGGQNG